MAVDGVDGCWLGPADLALSLGVQQGSPEHSDAIQHVLQARRGPATSACLPAPPALPGAGWLKAISLSRSVRDLSVLEGATQEILSKLHAVSG